MSENIIHETISFVKDQLKNAEGGHDWFHIERVYNNSCLIAKTEKCDILVVQLAALLHDIADSKFHPDNSGGDEKIGPETAKMFLKTQHVASEIVNHVVQIIENISFKGGHKSSSFTSIEFQIVQDADRLDAIGAVGVARAFNYGGFKNRNLYNPAIKPNLHLSKEEYKNSTAPTINHFYEKLLLLKDKMHTETAKNLAEERHRFMELFLQQFYKEWRGE